MPSGSSSDVAESSTWRPMTRRTARRGPPFNRRAYAARKAVNTLLVDQISGTIILALQVIERIVRVYTRIPGHQNLVRGLGLIHGLLEDLRQAFTPI